MLNTAINSRSLSAYRPSLLPSPSGNETKRLAKSKSSWICLLIDSCTVPRECVSKRRRPCCSWQDQFLITTRLWPLSAVLLLLPILPSDFLSFSRISHLIGHFGLWWSPSGTEGQSNEERLSGSSRACPPNYSRQSVYCSSDIQHVCPFHFTREKVKKWVIKANSHVIKEGPTFSFSTFHAFVSENHRLLVNLLFPSQLCTYFEFLVD